MKPSESDHLLTDLLCAVSRSFYLTLRVLPRPIRRPISIAYLLARTSDTIADTDVLPSNERLESLNQLDQAIQGLPSSPCDFSSFLTHQARPKERELLQRVTQSLSLLTTLPDDEIRLVRLVLQRIVSGQRLDLERFASSSPDHVIALPHDSDLDDYTYRVAGCVGEFWTHICFRHNSQGQPAPDDLVALGIRFGQGLQLVNILRDLAEDLAQGRCYLPSEALTKAELSAADLHLPENADRLQPLFAAYCERARAHLDAGWEYTTRLPWSWIRIRLACSWPILIGYQTLDILPSTHPADPSLRAKVTRRQVKSTIFRSIATYPFPFIWHKLPQKCR